MSNKIDGDFLNKKQTSPGQMDYESDIRNALLKDSATIPNVDKEFIAFKKRCNNSNKPKIRVKVVWGLAGFSAGIAVALICGLLLRYFFFSAEDSIIVYKAVKQNNNNIEMLSTPLMQYRSSIVNENINSTKKTVLQGDSIDMNQDANGVIEERVIKTPKGKYFNLLLSDGTKVLMSDESILRFPSKFEGDTRTVYLDGKAIFTVAKDASHPFIVKSFNYIIKALGTEFNVNSYMEDVRVTLIDGSVSVTDEESNESVVLQPGQEVSTINDKMIVVSSDLKIYNYWKEGFFYFDNVPLIDVLSQLGRWYNVNIKLTSSVLMSYRVHLVVDRNNTIDELIDILSKFSYLSIRIKGNNIIVDKNF